MMRKKREYCYAGTDACGSCVTGFDPEEVNPDIRELIEECCGDKEREEWLRDWDGGLSKRCVFHKSCWEALIQHFNNGPVPITKLTSVVEEAPWPQYNAYYVCENTGTPSPGCFRYINFRAEARKFPTATKIEFKTSPKSETQANDGFFLLPLEIRLEIAYLLPTPEYLNLRLVSKAMVPIFEYQEFWKTRFLIHRERGYLNYLLPEGRKDWRLMYRCTNKLGRLPTTMRFRRLQWLHNEWIKDRCMMVGGPLTAPSDNGNQFDGLFWEKAFGKIQCDRPYIRDPFTPLADGLCKRCRGVHKLLPRQMTAISNRLVEIAVSVLAEDEHTFITGFKLIYSESTPSTDFGYQIPQKQVRVDLHGMQLVGFEVFAGEGGIQAIRPIFDKYYGIGHSIIGKPNETCQSIQLTPDGEIKAFAGEFDHCRMVGLEIGTLRQ